MFAIIVPFLGFLYRILNYINFNLWKTAIVFIKIKKENISSASIGGY
jgi:hypothetical protein